MLFCRGDLAYEVTRRGAVEGKMVGDTVLDTHDVPWRGRSWYDSEKTLEGQVVTVRCAHGDTVL